MFEKFTDFTVTTQSEPEVSIYGIQSVTSPKDLPPLLLLHGFPQSRHIWHRVAPQLTDKYHVVIMDIRGYGESSKPKDVASYAKSAMARDCVVVMDKLGLDRPFFVCGHDRGARVAHKLCVDYPHRVHKAIFLDICPTLAMYTTTNLDFPRAYFHWYFLIQPEPLPEMLISAKPREVAQMFMGGRQKDGLDIFDAECFEYYVKSLGDPKTLHGMCNDYRASATLDLEEARGDLKGGKLIRCPLMVLWGRHGIVHKCFDAIEEWKAVTDAGVPVTGHSVDSGHYIPEQVPGDVVSTILEFFV